MTGRFAVLTPVAPVALAPDGAAGHGRPAVAGCQTGLRVTTAPLFDPGSGRQEITLPEGMTLATIVDAVLPGLGDDARLRVRATLVTERGVWMVEPARWHAVRPKAGVRIVIRLAPGGDNPLKAILSLVVTVAASFFAGPLALALGFQAGTFGYAVATAAISATIGFVGNALLNALFPAQRDSRESEARQFRIDGMRNEARPGAPIPSVLGRHRLAPAYALPPYTEIVGDQQYMRALFVVGYGPLTLSELRLGETPIDRYDEVQTEIRDGLDADDPVTLTPHQVIEEQYGTELTRPFPRDDAGEVVSGSTAEEKPVSRFTARDAAQACVILGFPTGLIRYDTKGGTAPGNVELRIRQRLNGAGAWSTVTTITITDSKREPFYRAHQWTLPSRGRWEIEVTRMTPEQLEEEDPDRSVWVALQSIRPEYPLNVGAPLSLVAMRIKATAQLSGPLDTFNLLADRRIADWDAGTETWIVRATRNPASLFRHALQGDENARPLADAGIDLAALQAWHEFCTDKGLKYDRVHDFEQPLIEALAEIAAAGRAAPRHDGIRWSVVIDDPLNGLVIDHVSSRNARDIRWRRAWPKPPHEFRVPFLDETNDYKPAERRVPWPGHAGPVTVSEELRLPGKTDPVEIWLETRRRQYEAERRMDSISAVQDGHARTATRGDLVALAIDHVSSTLAVTAVRKVDGPLVELVDAVTVEDGTSYAIRFRVPAADDATPDESVVRTVTATPGAATLLTLIGTGDVPVAGDIVHFGVAGAESVIAYLTATEAGDGGTSVLSMVPAAAEIDMLMATEVAPAWDGRYGEAGEGTVAAPASPRIVGIDHDVGVANTTNAVIVRLAPAVGELVPLTSYTVRHRLSGGVSWTEIAATAAAASATITGYADEDEIEMAGRANGANGQISGWGATVPFTLGVPAPAPAAALSATVTGGLGAAALTVVTPAGPVSQLHVWTGPTSDFEDASKVASYGAVPSSTIAVTLGDATRPNVFATPVFAADADWTKGTGWAIAAGVATKTTGTESDITQALSPVAGAVWRWAVTVSGRTAGAVRALLSGGTEGLGTSLTANARARGTVTAGAGNTAGGFRADASFDGSIDDAVLYLPSAASLAQGVIHVFVTLANSDGAEGPALHAGAATID